MAQREYFDSLEETLRAWGRYEATPDRIARAVAAVQRVVALDSPCRPAFYITAERNYVGVLDEAGTRLVRIEGRKVRSRHQADGFILRSAAVGRSLPDPNLPFVLEV